MRLTTLARTTLARTILAPAILTPAILTPILFGIALVVGAPADAAPAPVNKTLLGGLALDGYDAVAYFTDGKAVEGSKELTLDWNGATWRFASAAHRTEFEAAPEKYAPQYGGYCAWAVSQNYTADSDPEAWTIVDGRLYLNYNRKIMAQWKQDLAGNVAKANGNWPKLVAGD